MKSIFLSALCFVLFITGYSQNILSNGSFESYTTCPHGDNEVGKCIGWRTYNGQPDYYNACDPTNSNGVPVNCIDTLFAYNGNAYIGLADAVDNDFREYIATSFPALKINATYEFSMFVSLANTSAVASNGLGVYFYQKGPAAINSQVSLVLPVKPQISFASYGPITTKKSWIKLVGTFVADSAYTNLVIGGFLSQSKIKTIPSPQPPGFTYYYIDSVVLQQKTLGINEIREDDIINIYPNPNDGHFIITDISSSKQVQLQILNPIGQVVDNEIIIPENGKIQVNSLQNLSAGIYTISLYDGEVLHRSRIIIH